MCAATMTSGLLINARMSAVSFLHETSLVAKLGCAVLFFFYVMSFIFDVLKPFGILPGNLIPPNFWIWTIITHQFVEINTFLLVGNCVLLIFASRNFEATWNVVGYLTFFAVVTVISGLLTGAFYLFVYMLTFNIEYLFDVSIYGLSGYAAGVLVALKQSRGDQMLIGTVGLHIRHLPVCYIALAILCRIIGIIPGSNVVLICFGTLVSWTYLRFYQSHSRGRGDNADKFSFKSFFPPPIEAPIGVLSNLVFNVLLKLKICRKTTYRYDVGAPSKITITLSGVDALDAERRRNKAIKALDERLQKAESAQEANADWPDLDMDDIESKPLVEKSALEDQVSNSSSGSTPSSDIIRIDVETSSPSDENNA